MIKMALGSDGCGEFMQLPLLLVVVFEGFYALRLAWWWWVMVVGDGGGNGGGWGGIRCWWWVGGGGDDDDGGDDGDGGLGVGSHRGWIDGM